MSNVSITGGGQGWMVSRLSMRAVGVVTVGKWTKMGFNHFLFLSKLLPSEFHEPTSTKCYHALFKQAHLVASMLMPLQNQISKRQCVGSYPVSGDPNRKTKETLRPCSILLHAGIYCQVQSMRPWRVLANFGTRYVVLAPFFSFHVFTMSFPNLATSSPSTRA